MTNVFCMAIVQIVSITRCMAIEMICAKNVEVLRMTRLEKIRLHKTNELNGWKMVNKMFRLYFERRDKNGE